MERAIELQDNYEEAKKERMGIYDENDPREGDGGAGFGQNELCIDLDDKHD